MRAKFLQKNTQSADSSFFVNYAEVSHSYDKYHYHKEYELAFHIENRGTRYIGDSIRRFNSGDLVLLGPDIPHYWHSDNEYYEDPEKTAKLIVIHFLADFPGQHFFDTPEMKPAKELLEKAKSGIQFFGQFAHEIGAEMLKMNEQTGWKRMISLISILNKMGESKDYNLLVSSGFYKSYYKNHNEEKLTKIYNFIIENHAGEISLEKIAGFANMNPSAFCRYFKDASGKTFSDVLNEVRIGAACRNLINTDMDIAQIGFESGYENTTYFNRQFKQIKKLTPLQYRLKYKQ